MQVLMCARNKNDIFDAVKEWEGKGWNVQVCLLMGQPLHFKLGLFFLPQCLSTCQIAGDSS